MFIYRFLYLTYDIYYNLYYIYYYIEYTKSNIFILIDYITVIIYYYSNVLLN